MGILHHLPLVISLQLKHWHLLDFQLLSTHKKLSTFSKILYVEGHHNTKPYLYYSTYSNQIYTKYLYIYTCKMITEYGCVFMMKTYYWRIALQCCYLSVVQSELSQTTCMLVLYIRLFMKATSFQHMIYLPLNSKLILQYNIIMVHNKAMKILQSHGNYIHSYCTCRNFRGM